MILVVQRVREASVRVEGETVGAIERGLLLLACAEVGDTDDELLWLADKVVDLRLFADPEGRTNLSLLDVGGAVLLVSQFTLAADWRRGRRPSFGRAAAPPEAQERLAFFGRRVGARGVIVAGGRFGALMEVALINEGPFTLVLDSAASPTRRAGQGQPPPPPERA